MTLGFRRLSRALLGAILLLGLAAGTGSAAATITLAATPTYTSTVLADPSGSDGNQATLQAISCPAAGSCIAAGYYEKSTGNTITNLPYVATLSNNVWTATTLSAPNGNLYARLSAISCQSMTSCVAVGSDQNSLGGIGAGTEVAFAEVLSGTTWTLQTLAQPSLYNYLTGVSCVSASSCVAVGNQSSGNGGSSLAYSYNGTAWTPIAVTLANAPTYSSLSAVSCISSTLCQAVGSTGDGQGHATPLTATYGGSTFSATKLSNPSFAGSRGASFSGVACLGVDVSSCLAVGTAEDVGQYQGSAAYTEPAAGGTVTELNPDVNNYDTSLFALTCIDTTHCAASGQTTDYTVNTTTGVTHSLVYTLTGTSWTQTTVSDATGNHNYPRLDGISCVTDTSHCYGAGSVDGESAPMVATNAGSVSTPTASKLSVSAPSTATEGSSFNVTVTAQDSSNATVTSYSGSKSITFSGPGNAPDGTAPSYPSTVTFTNGVGTASVTLYKAETHTLSATDSTISGTSGSIAVAAGSTSALSVTGLPSQTTAGTAQNFTVTAQDAHRNTATGYGGTVHFTSSDGAAVLPPDSSLVSGARTVSVTLKTVGNQSVTATDTTTSSLTGTVSTTVSAAAAHHFTVSTSATGTAGSSQNVTVTAKDAYGNVATSYTGGKTIAVTGLANSPNGNSPTEPTSATFSSGATTIAVTPVKAETTSVTASVSADSLTGTSGTLTVNPATTQRIALTGLASSVTAGSSTSFTATAVDSYGNTTPGYAGTLHFTSSDTNATLPDNSTLTSGTGNFNVTFTTAGQQSVTATDTTTSSFTGSAGTTVAAAAASHFTVSTSATGTAGSSQNVTVTAKDAYGNVVTSYTGSKSIAVTGLANSPNGNSPTEPTSATFSSGATTIAVTPVNAETTTVTASVSADSLSGTSGSVTVNPAATTAIAVTNLASSVTAGSSTSFTATAVDSYGNITPTYAGTLHFTSSDSSASLPDDSTLTSGTGNFNVTFTTAGQQSVTATDSDDSNITGTASSTVTPAAATHYGVTAPSSGTAGTASIVSISALDDYGNTDTSYAGDKDLVVSGLSNSPDDDSPSVPTSATFTSGVAQISVTPVDAETATISVTGDQLSGSSNDFAVDPSTTHGFTLLGQPYPIVAGGSAPFYVHAVDVYGNTTPGYTGTVHFTSTDPHATLPDNSTLTNGTGSFNATFEAAGVQSITATDTADSTLTGTWTRNVAPAEVAAYSVSAPTSGTVGTPATVTVTAVDQYGNTNPSYTGNKAVVVSGLSDAPNGTTASVPTQATFTSGVASLTVTPVKAETTQITVVRSTLTGTSGDIAVAPGSASALSLTGVPTTTTAGDVINAVVTARDSYGNVATGYTGTLQTTSTDSSAALPDNTNATAGVANLAVTLKTAGAKSVTVTDTAVSALTATANSAVSAATASALALSAPGSAIAGHPFGVTIKALDSYGNTVTSYAGPKSLTFTGADSSPSGTAPTLPTSAIFISGQATPSPTLTKAVSTTLTATVGTLTGSSGSISVNPASGHSFQIGYLPDSMIAGDQQVISVQALDTYGNYAYQYTGAVHITSTDTQAVLPADTNMVNGLASGIHVTLKSAGNQQVTATDTVNSTITGTASTLVGHAAASAFAVSAPAADTAGQAINVVVTATDAYGNTATDYSGSHPLTVTGLAAAPNGTAATVPANSTFSAGSATLAVTPFAAESAVIHVSDGSLDGDSGQLVIGPAGTATLNVAPGSITTPAGQPVAFTTIGYDSYGNSTGSQTANSLFSVTHGTCNAASCAATAATPSGQPDTVTATLPNSASGTAQLTVTPAALDHITVSTGSAGNNGDPISVSSTGFDAYGNKIGSVSGVVLSIAPDGTCTATSCTPATGGPHTITATVATPHGAAPTSSASATTVPGYRAPSITGLSVRPSDGQAVVSYAADTFGAAPVQVVVTASAPGYPTRTVTGAQPTGALTVRGLADSVAYTFTVRVTTALGTASEATAGTATPARVPRVTLSARRLKAGRVLLFGSVLDGRTPKPFRVVTITATVAGHTFKVATLRTDRAGRFQTVVRPTRPVTFIATALFGPTGAPTVSRNRPLTVTPA